MNRLLSLLARRLSFRTEAGLDALRLAIGKQESRLVRSSTFARLRDAEFQVFSQWGEDGILQYLLGKVSVPSTSFVELGVEDYSESNTRFLLCNDNWKGLIVDAGMGHQRFLQARGLDWRYSISAVSAFITRENVNRIIEGAGFGRDLGLLSIDIDGNDYWVMEAIDTVAPRIMVVEYNSLFGPKLAVTVPYRPDFERGKAHHSHLFYGASISALVGLAGRKGYACVGGNSAGNNVFFVRRDVRGALPEVSAEGAWVASRFRESRDREGRLTLLTRFEERQALLADEIVIDLAGGGERRLGDLLMAAG